ncbi:KdsC family phosphatase [Capnocytophaga sp. ARDL2]|uniref:KdsC family phosphatase n=1 Tax=Capnocytophaga sp. ARDL2 TaxID=3238809 RepID=UPI00355740D3
MSYKHTLNNISTFIFDVDGVLTDGSILVTEEGQLLRSMNIKDGFAIKTAIDKGYTVVIISGGTNEGVRVRLNKLGVQEVHLGVKDKIKVLNEIAEKYKISFDEMLYMGDDIPDIEPMNECALPSCPQDAVAEVKAVAQYISHKEGGKGAVRDVIEQVMKVQGKW